MTGADITMIPFKGAMPALTALLGGHTESSFTAVAITYPHYKSGKVRPVLLDQKVADLPGGLTLQEMGYKRGLPLTFFAFLAPAGIPEEAKKGSGSGHRESGKQSGGHRQIEEHADYPQL